MRIIMAYLRVIVIGRGRSRRELVGVVGLRGPLALLGRGGRRGGRAAPPRLAGRAAAPRRARAAAARRAVDHLK